MFQIAVCVLSDEKERSKVRRKTSLMGSCSNNEREVAGNSLCKCDLQKFRAQGVAGAATEKKDERQEEEDAGLLLCVPMVLSGPVIFCCGVASAGESSMCSSGDGRGWRGAAAR